jgi:hypothetical protein
VDRKELDSSCADSDGRQGFTQSQTVFDKRETVSFTGQICYMQKHDDSAVVPPKAQQGLRAVAAWQLVTGNPLPSLQS